MLDQYGTDQMMKHRNDGWDESLRYQYPLTAESVVWDVGAWQGDFARRMVEQYDCTVRIFEILPARRYDLTYWFLQDEKVRIEPYGLAARDDSRGIRDVAECTSMLVTGTTLVIMRRASHVLTEPVDLLKMNVEGAEFDILPDLLDAGKLPLVNYLQVQFHDILRVDGIYIEIPGAHEQYAQIAARLSETHELQWRQPWVWESWRRKDFRG